MVVEVTFLVIVVFLVLIVAFADVDLRDAEVLLMYRLGTFEVLLCDRFVAGVKGVLSDKMFGSASTAPG